MAILPPLPAEKYERLGEGAGAFPLPEPHKDDPSAFNFSGVDFDETLNKAASAPGATSSVIDTDAEIVVPTPEQRDEDSGKVVPITRARGFVSTGDIMPDGPIEEEYTSRRPRLSIVTSESFHSRIDAAPLSRRRLLGYVAAGVLAMTGTAAVITDGFGKFGPTKQNIERIQEKHKEILDSLKSNPEAAEIKAAKQS